MCFVALMGPFLTGLSQAQRDPVCRPCALDWEGGGGGGMGIGLVCRVKSYIQPVLGLQEAVFNAKQVGIACS